MAASVASVGDGNGSAMNVRRAADTRSRRRVVVSTEADVGEGGAQGGGHSLRAEAQPGSQWEWGRQRLKSKEMSLCCFLEFVDFLTIGKLLYMTTRPVQHGQVVAR